MFTRREKYNTHINIWKENLRIRFLDRAKLKRGLTIKNYRRKQTEYTSLKYNHVHKIRNDCRTNEGENTVDEHCLIISKCEEENFSLEEAYFLLLKQISIQNFLGCR